jgi:hypothetical protein
MEFRFKKADLGIFNDAYADNVVINLKKDSRIMGLTRGNFSLIDLIYSTLKKIGKSDVFCVTWSAGIKDVNNVKWLMDSEYINKFILITDHSYKTRQKKYAASIEDIFGIENIRTSEVHAKFVLIHSPSSDMYVTIRTSMNLNANKTCESFEIDECKDIFDFYKSFVNNVCENQKAGFIESSTIVNKTLDIFFKSKLENQTKGWSEI